MKTVSEIRRSFWNIFPDFKKVHYKKTKRQNQYNATIRIAFVTYVDCLAKDGIISESLAQKATL